MHKNYKAIFLAMFVVVVLVFAGIVFRSARSADVAELNFKRKQLEEQLDSINKKISGLQSQIEGTRKQAASLKNEVLIYDSQIQSTELQIQAKETQIQDTNLQIDELQTQIDRRTQEIQQNRLVLSQLILEVYERGGDNFVQIALGTDDLSKFMDQMQYTGQVQEKIFQIVQNIKQVKTKLEQQQADLKITLNKLEELAETLKETQDSLAIQRKDKQNLLAKTRGVEKNYQNLLAQSKSASEELQSEIEDLDAEVRRQLGDKSLILKSGALAMPMKGIITQKYGNTGFRSLGYSFHNGWDIAAPAGQPIYASASGVVNGCNSSNASYGNWCTVKHTIAAEGGDRCIVTLYAHMKSIKVNSGQTVAQGDLIGYEGNTGNTTRLLYGPERGYHLHFTIFDCEKFGIAEGKYSKTYGGYSVPYGYTYDPAKFLK